MGILFYERLVRKIAKVLLNYFVSNLILWRLSMNIDVVQIVYSRWQTNWTWERLRSHKLSSREIRNDFDETNQRHESCECFANIPYYWMRNGRKLSCRKMVFRSQHLTCDTQKSFWNNSKRKHIHHTVHAHAEPTIWQLWSFAINYYRFFSW